MYILFPCLRLRVSVFAIPSFLLLLWIEGTLPFLILILSALLHELGHLAAIKWCGHRVRRVDILPMGALIVCPEGITDADEVKIALSGPFSSLFAALFSCLMFAVWDTAFVLYSAVINFALGIFNLIPVSKTDGGKALSCFLSQHKVRNSAAICTAASCIAVAAFIIVAAFTVVTTGFNLGVIALSVSLLIQLM